MRKVDKSELGREIKKNVRNIMPDYANQFPPDSIPVIDGGWLLHFIRWKKNATYADVLGFAGLRLFCLLYGGTKTDTLTSLRYERYMTMMAKSNKVVLQ